MALPVCVSSSLHRLDAHSFPIQTLPLASETAIAYGWSVGDQPSGLVLVMAGL